MLRNMPQGTVGAQTAHGPRATGRGLTLVSIIADACSGLTLADIARAAELSPSTALRQLRSLEAVGFAARDGESRYIPGPELLRIARKLAAGSSLIDWVQPTLVRLTETTGESAYLAEPTDRFHATYVAMEPSPHSVRHVTWLGRAVPRRGSAVGAALAGRMDVDGVAVRDDAVEPGITAIAAPVRDVRGRIIATLSVVGPTFRLAGPALQRARSAVASAAEELSHR